MKVKILTYFYLFAQQIYKNFRIFVKFFTYCFLFANFEQKKARIFYIYGLLIYTLFDV